MRGGQEDGAWSVGSEKAPLKKWHFSWTSGMRRQDGGEGTGRALQQERAGCAKALEGRAVAPWRTQGCLCGLREQDSGVLEVRWGCGDPPFPAKQTSGTPGCINPALPQKKAFFKSILGTCYRKREWETEHKGSEGQREKQTRSEARSGPQSRDSEIITSIEADS